MIRFHSCLGCAVFTVNLMCIIVSHPIGNISIKLKLGKNNRSIPDQSSSEYVGQFLTGTCDGDSDGSRNSTGLQNVPYNVNNIYIIGDILNASVVKLGESSAGKSPAAAAAAVTDKKNVEPPPPPPTDTSTEDPECNATGAKPTKTRMPEYFEDAASTQTTQQLKTSSTSAATHRFTDNTEITCHCPSRAQD